jgi:hypothetical protein
MRGVLELSTVPRVGYTTALRDGSRVEINARALPEFCRLHCGVFRHVRRDESSNEALRLKIATLVPIEVVVVYCGDIQVNPFATVRDGALRVKVCADPYDKMSAAMRGVGCAKKAARVMFDFADPLQGKRNDYSDRRTSIGTLDRGLRQTG